MRFPRGHYRRRRRRNRRRSSSCFRLRRRRHRDCSTIRRPRRRIRRPRRGRRSSRRIHTRMRRKRTTRTTRMRDGNDRRCRHRRYYFHRHRPSPRSDDPCRRRIRRATTILRRCRMTMWRLDRSSYHSIAPASPLNLYSISSLIVSIIALLESIISRNLPTEFDRIPTWLSHVRKRQPDPAGAEGRWGARSFIFFLD